MSRISENKDILGYILMENDTTFGQVENVQVVKDSNLFYLRYDATLQSVDCENRNHNWYTGDAIVGSLSDDTVKELIAHKKALGEAGHPVDGSPRRIATVMPNNSCHVLTGWWRDGNLIKGHLETLAGFRGPDLTACILQGMDSSYSFRGFAKMETQRGKPGIKVITLPPKYVAYDEVVLPSHKEAYQDKGKTAVTKDWATGKEATMALENAYPSGDMSIPVTPSYLGEMVKDKSENLAIICESLDLDPNNLITVNNKGVATLHGKKEKAVFTLESQLVREAAEAWKTFKF